MTDAQFIAAFESGVLPNQAFRHRDHLRLAWLYLQRAPYHDAVVLMEQSIRRFAAHHGALDKYHHTVTVVWMRLVAAAAANGGPTTFDRFIAANRHLLDKEAPRRFYSAERLSSAAAKAGWLDPDLRPLPAVTAERAPSHN